MIVPHLYVVREDGEPGLRLWAQTMLVEASVLTDMMARAEGSNLFLQGTHPLIQADALVRTVVFSRVLPPVPLRWGRLRLAFNHGGHVWII
jgi:hypothetical protein